MALPTRAKASPETGAHITGNVTIDGDGALVRNVTFGEGSTVRLTGKGVRVQGNIFLGKNVYVETADTLTLE